MELALGLEKLNFQKLRALHEVAEKHGDSQMCDFVGTWGVGGGGWGGRAPLATPAGRASRAALRP